MSDAKERDRYEEALEKRIALATEKEKKALEDKLSKYREENEKKEAVARAKLDRELASQEHEKRLEELQTEGKTFGSILEKSFGTAAAAFETVSSAASGITNQLDSIIDKYAATMQSISGGLIGVGGSSALKTLTDKLQETLSTTSFVRQENVYANLAKLVQGGIVYNVEQRAFLQTLADDIDLVFSGTDASLNRLINLYQTDITAERMAIEYNLKEFLNSNYKTSQYISEQFANISNSLTEVIALSGGNMGLESTIQTWLGSYYSAGFDSSTVSGLAQALNALGTGDISSIGSGISNLVLMGVAKAGLDYGKLLNEGISQSDVERIMSSVASYVGSLSGESNVVKSQLASIFGFNVADIIAAQNKSLPIASYGVSTNISNMLDSYADLVPAVKGIQNTLGNMMYSWGTNIADNETLYLAYEGAKLVGETVGKTLSGSGTKLGAIAGGILQIAPLIVALGGAVDTFGDIQSSGFSLSGLLHGDVGNLTSIYKSLGGVLKGGSFVMSSAGVSGSMGYSNTGSNSLLQGTKSSIGVTETETYGGETERTTDDAIFALDTNVLTMLEFMQSIDGLQLTITNALNLSNIGLAFGGGVAGALGSAYTSVSNG